MYVHTFEWVYECVCVCTCVCVSWQFLLGFAISVSSCRGPFSCACVSLPSTPCYPLKGSTLSQRALVILMGSGARHSSPGLSFLVGKMWCQGLTFLALNNSGSR